MALWFLAWITVSLMTLLTKRKDIGWGVGFWGERIMPGIHLGDVPRRHWSQEFGNVQIPYVNNRWLPAGVVAKGGLARSGENDYLVQKKTLHISISTRGIILSFLSKQWIWSHKKKEVLESKVKGWEMAWKAECKCIKEKYRMWAGRDMWMSFSHYGSDEGSWSPPSSLKCHSWVQVWQVWAYSGLPDRNSKPI